MAPDHDSQSFDIDDLASLPEPERLVFDDDFGPPPTIEVDLRATEPEPVPTQTSMTDLRVARKLGLRGRLKLWEQRIVNRGEDPGADTKPPASAPATPSRDAGRSASTSSEPVLDERFARLLRPLAPSELRQLETDVQKAELFFDTVDRAKRVNERIRAASLVAAMAVLALFLWLRGESYLLGLADAPVPGWLNAPGLSADHRTYIVYLAGFFLPLVAVYLVAETLALLMRAVRHRLIGPLLPAAVAGTACMIVWILMARMDVLPGLLVGLIGVIASSLLSGIALSSSRRRRR